MEPKVIADRLRQAASDPQSASEHGVLNMLADIFDPPAAVPGSPKFEPGELVVTSAGNLRYARKGRVYWINGRVDVWEDDMRIATVEDSYCYVEQHLEMVFTALQRLGKLEAQIAADK